MDWTIPTFNTRETSLAIWIGGGLLLLAVIKRDVRHSFGAVIRTLIRSTLLVTIIVSAANYSTGAVLLWRQVIPWSDELTKVAAIWFFGFAFLALFETRDVDGRYFRRIGLRALGVAAVVEFVSNLHTFPLPGELILVPVVLLLAGSQAVADASPEYASARTPIAWMLGLIGAASLVFSLAYLATHSSDVLTAEKARAFFLPVVLTVFFIPYLFVLRLWVVYQTTLHMTEAGIPDRALARKARREIVKTCGLNLAKIQLFESQFRNRLWGAESEREVKDVLAAFSESWARGRRATDAPARATS